MIIVRVPTDFNPMLHSLHLHDLLQQLKVDGSTRVIHRANHLSRHEFGYLSAKMVEQEAWYDPSLSIYDIKSILDIEGKKLVVALPCNAAIFSLPNRLKPTKHVSGTFAAFTGV